MSVLTPCMAGPGELVALGLQQSCGRIRVAEPKAWIILERTREEEVQSVCVWGGSAGGVCWERAALRSLNPLVPSETGACVSHSQVKPPRM